MNIRKQHLALAVLWAYLLSPLALQPFFMDGRGWFDVLFLFNVFTSVLWLGLLTGWRIRPVVFHLFAAPLYLLTAADLFMLFIYGNRLSSAYIGIVLSDYREAAEFLSSFMQPVLISLAVLLLVYLSGLAGIRGLQARRSNKTGLICAVVLLLTYSAQLVNTYRNEESFRIAALDVLGKELGAPMGPLFQASIALILKAEAGDLLEKRKHFAFTAVTAREISPQSVYVWIVGESSRPDNWGLLGYARDTTPRLNRIPGIVPLRDLLTNAPVTSHSVTSMFSLRPIAEWDAVLSERSIISVFNQAGFNTFWLSTQEADGWGGLIQHVAAEAKQRRYFDRALDAVLVDEFRRIIRNKPATQPLFVILHTKGSHWRYDRRYPEDFRKFRNGESYREKLVDSYDNSILYTDWVVSEIISTVAQGGNDAAVFYVSDHGQNLLDDDAQLFGHAIGNRYDLHTAGMVWLSPALMKKRAAAYAQVQKHQSWPISIADLPHSFLDLAGIDVNGLNPGQSIFNAHYAVRERWYRLRGVNHRETSAER